MHASHDLVVGSGSAARGVSLDALLTPAAVDAAEHAANAWVKALRHARVDGVPFRDRFTLRGDSLWWFAEIYLHKMRVVSRAHRVIAALGALDAERPTALAVPAAADPVLAHVVREWGRRRGVAVDAPQLPAGRTRLAQAAKALFHTSSAVVDRIRPGRAPLPSRAPTVAAFVHTAFWRRDHGETYIGPVLDAITARVPADEVCLVGVGPRTNFRVRRWRDRVQEFGDPSGRGLPLTPVESYAAWRDLRPSLRIWSERGRVRRSIEASPDIREHAVVGGCDLWPLLREEFAGVAELQLPWSARAMDEAGAALDVLQPRVVVTYAEAGGWGRALMLEARRRGVPSVGLQHGFIYRHWLNYLHEPDEMLPSPGNPADAGFPRPTLTLVFDDFAAAHLAERGRFPAGSVAVTGSPRLDAFVATATGMDDAARAALRQEVGLGPGQHLVLVAAKRAQLGTTFPALVAAVAERRDVVLLVKPHPAEGAEAYAAESEGVPNVKVAPSTADLARLTAVARVLVTANSTAAIEAMAIDVPALVVALPNNLTPFVDAGAMAGADAAGLGEALSRLLYDGESRARLTAGRRSFMDRYRIRADGTAAAHSAETILTLAQAPAAPRQPALGRPPAPA